ncbi:recombinase family protein [Acidocella facilis]|uniref:recombinase family protein n=1 Tax=Acidocella facilis TaxID=525 RepID=UPI001F2F9663|nr:recombinase family protein [Acidocella facilis]
MKFQKQKCQDGALDFTKLVHRMALKRTPSDDEINALAAKFLALWSSGDVIRPWLRLHAEMLLALVQSGWSWAAIARAMTMAGITYRTGKPWTADWLQSEAYRARLPLKGYRRRNQTRSSQSLLTQTPMPPAPPVSAQFIKPYPSDVAGEPEFQPARFIDWEVRRSETDAPPADEQAAPIIRPPSPTYDEVMERLLGKKPRS